jgi:hypothetical protein
MGRAVWACTGSACFIARLSSSVEHVARRNDVQELFGQDAVGGYSRSRDAVQADVDAWRQVSATTNLNDPTTMRESR